MKTDESAENVGASPTFSQTDTSQASARVLGVMAKYWSVGSVKTRLGRTIGMQAAADIHEKFVRHLSNSLQSAADQRFFTVAPSNSVERFREAIPAAWQINTQSNGDLGSRIEHWFRSSLSSDPQQTAVDSVLIGADCPQIDESVISDSFAALENHDVVLGPAADGGYYLIGLRGPWRDPYQHLLSEIPWSTDQVFTTTVERIGQHGLSLHLLDQRQDIDTISELDQLRESLDRTRGEDPLDEVLAVQLDQILNRDQR